MARELLLQVLFDHVGPSVNKMYFTLPHGRGKRVLTGEGVTFKNAMHMAVTEAWKEAGLPTIDEEEMLDLELWFRFEKLRDAKGRFVKLDASNRIKITEDALMAALGIDDQQNFHLDIWKTVGPPATLIRLWRLEEMPVWPIPT